MGYRLPKLSKWLCNFLRSQKVQTETCSHNCTRVEWWKKGLLNWKGGQEKYNMQARGWCLWFDEKGKSWEQMSTCCLDSAFYSRRYSFPQTHFALKHTHFNLSVLWWKDIDGWTHAHRNLYIWYEARRSIWLKPPKWHVVAELYAGNCQSQSSERGENSPRRIEV